MVTAQAYQEPLPKIAIAAWSRVMRGREQTDWMLPMFWSMACMIPKVQIGEIGFRHGTSAVAWLLAAREVDGHLHSVDIDACEAGNFLVDELDLRSWFTFTQSDSRDFTFPKMLDILFIDGDHAYECVKADYFTHRESVKPGGLIFLHDTVSWPGVTRFVAEQGIPNIPFGLGGLAVEVVK